MIKINMMVNDAAIFWSGGKDSAYALYEVMKTEMYNVRYLITTMHEGTQRVSMHGVRKELIEQQSASLDIPILWMQLGGDGSEYDDKVREILELLKVKNIHTVIFGDIYLEDLKEYRLNLFAGTGVEAVFPLWGKDTSDLVQKIIDDGFKTVICACREQNRDWAGNTLDLDFLNKLSSDVDPCGENGEFHSFVYDGPIFKFPLKWEKGECLIRSYQVEGAISSFCFLDILPVKN
ncbi:MAG: diphthine--ammonia ligase [Cytophagaceae bacterium]